MPTELTNLDLMEVSLVDAGDDPLAKVSLFKRKQEENNMEDEEIEKQVEIEVGEDDTSGEEDMTEDDTEKGCDEKQTRKSWKAEALALGEVVKGLEAKIAEMEAAQVEKAAPKEEMIEVGGEMVAKSSIPSPVLKQLEELQKAKEAEELRKRAEEVLPNFKGTADQRGKLLKFVGSDEELITLLRAADAAFAGIFQEVGKTDAEDDLKTPDEKLKGLVKAYQEEKGEKDFYKAYAAVTKTAQGKDLLRQAYKQ